MQAFEYLMSGVERAGGHVTRENKTLFVHAHGLPVNTSCEIFILYGKDVLLHREIIDTDENGALQYRIKATDNQEYRILIADTKGSLLRSPSISAEQSRLFLWRMRQKIEHRIKSPDTCFHNQSNVLVSPCTVQETEDQSESIPNATRIVHKQPVNQLPGRNWKGYPWDKLFESDTCRCVSFPMNITPWRFIESSANTTSGSNTYSCCIGRLFKNCCLAASALVIKEKELEKGCSLPGFKYQKALNGEGFWWKVNEH